MPRATQKKLHSDFAPAVLQAMKWQVELDQVNHRLAELEHERAHLQKLRSMLESARALEQAADGERPSR